MIGKHAIDQADAARFFGAELTTGIGQFTQHAVADDARQALQGADVGGHADVDFLDRELRVLGCIAHVARADQVDGAANAVALDRRQHGLAASVHGVERSLQLENLAAQQARIATHVLAKIIGDRGQHHQVDARGKMLARAAEHHGTHGVGLVDPLEDVDDFGPERRVHGVDLFRAIDLHMGNVAAEFDNEGLVFGHGSDP